MNCTNCSSNTSNAKFCSRSCATSYFNKVNPKRKRGRKCKTCGLLVLSRERYCSNCLPKRVKIKDVLVTVRRDSIASLSKAEALTSDTQKYRRIRSHAQHIASLLGKLSSCAVCNYSRYVETCHIKPISSYPNTALVSEINSPDNLVGLCPTHHWELDHGFLQVKPVPVL